MCQLSLNYASGAAILETVPQQELMLSSVGHLIAKLARALLVVALLTTSAIVISPQFDLADRDGDFTPSIPVVASIGLGHSGEKPQTTPVGAAAEIASIVPNRGLFEISGFANTVSGGRSTLPLVCCFRC